MGKYQPSGIGNWRAPTTSTPNVGDLSPDALFVARPDQMPEPGSADRHIEPHNFGQVPGDLTAPEEGPA
jgi:hypothetical protein